MEVNREHSVPFRNEVIPPTLPIQNCKPTILRRVTTHSMIIMRQIQGLQLKPSQFGLNIEGEPKKTKVFSGFMNQRVMNVKEKAELTLGILTSMQHMEDMELKKASND